MSQYRHRLPQLDDRLFITDGGLETTLIFHEGIDLPYFAAFDLLKDAAGTEVLEHYYRRYADMAVERGVGLVLEAPTWRANPDWGAKLGYDPAALDEANRKAISMLLSIRATYETAATPIVISGNLGPRGDGYRPDLRMTVAQAGDYHYAQVETFARTDADMVAAFTMNYVEEAIGIVKAAKACGIPVAISFTLETDGRLPSGDALKDAIVRTDEETDAYAVYYMLNCAHPTHFAQRLEDGGAWIDRIRGLRANASRRSHAELDEAPDLDDGNPGELGEEYGALYRYLPQMTVVGGCCGTDHRHVGAICRAMEKAVASGTAAAIA